LTAYRVILLPDTFPEYAKLTHFFAYFHTISPVYFQIWRQNYTDGTFSLKFNKKALPDVTMTSQTVSKNRLD
jgi:hypothetical protein